MCNVDYFVQTEEVLNVLIKFKHKQKTLIFKIWVRIVLGWVRIVQVRIVPVRNVPVRIVRVRIVLHPLLPYPIFCVYIH